MLGNKSQSNEAIKHLVPKKKISMLIRTSTNFDEYTVNDHHHLIYGSINLTLSLNCSHMVHALMTPPKEHTYSTCNTFIHMNQLKVIEAYW